MQDLINSYQQIKPSIVAIVSRISSNPEFPDIIGTGFIADSDGLILTCNHVIDLIKKLPRRKNASPEEWPIEVLSFKQFPEGLATIPIDVVGIGKPAEWKRGFDYAPDLPDVGLIRVNVKNLPSADILTDGSELIEGKPVAFSGFPMGTDTLRAPGWIHQFTPTLQNAIIAAIMPFPCSNPHAIMLNVMTQGGASGSPVFSSNNGKVIAMVYGGLNETYRILGERGIVSYKVPTNLTIAVTGWILKMFFESFKNSKEYKEHNYTRKDYNDMLEKAAKEVKTGIPFSPLKTIKNSEIEFPIKSKI